MSFMRIILLLAAVTVLSTTSKAQFGWDDEPDEDSEESVLDEFDAALRVPVIAPIRPLRPVIAPVLADPFEPIITRKTVEDDCGFEPEVAAAYRKADLDDEECPKFLGRLSANPYATDSTANPYSAAGSPYSPKSINNPYGQFGSPYSPQSARNPYATDAPKIVAQDGEYLGRLSKNPYDPDSVANPYGRFGSPFSPTSINNPFSAYGSPYSPQSPNNPYATQAPLLFGD